MNKSDYQFIRNKKVTDSHCAKFTIIEIIKVLRNDKESLLWDIVKKNWSIQDWKEFYKLKADNYENQ